MLSVTFHRLTLRCLCQSDCLIQKWIFLQLFPICLVERESGKSFTVVDWNHKKFRIPAVVNKLWILLYAADLII